MKRALTTVVVWLVAASARADVVEACPLPWQEGGVGHGMDCTTNWPVVGIGTLGCAIPLALVVGLGLLLVRRPAAGRTRGD